mmetsp:Transcript_49809/g.144835  ORF Transcript_49809/g.144835 Transcript_49809/m.144835 type:complete len:204 (+) Transcript_49809:201-812(+)
MTKDNMFSIQMRGVFARNEKLTTIGAGASICHGKLSSFGVFDDEVFIREFLAVNGFTACSIPIREIPSLNHEIFDHTMERASLEMKWFACLALAFFARTQASKVFGRFWSYVLVQLHHDASKIIISLLNLEVYVRIVSVGVGNNGSLLVIVNVDLSQESAKCGLFFLLRVLNFFLELSQCLADIFVGVVNFVGSHEVHFGFLV